MTSTAACSCWKRTPPIGPGDRYIAERLRSDTVIALNKIDRADGAKVLKHLAFAAAELGLADAKYFPVSARSGRGGARHSSSTWPPACLEGPRISRRAW